jgi:hypothetical protein
MKTQAQHRQDVVNYLRTSSKHAFLRGEKGTFKIEEVSEGVFNEFILGKASNKDIDIDYWVKEYMGDAKNVIKHRIFYDSHDYKGIPMKYYTKLIL